VLLFHIFSFRLDMRSHKKGMYMIFLLFESFALVGKCIIEGDVEAWELWLTVNSRSRDENMEQMKQSKCQFEMKQFVGCAWAFPHTIIECGSKVKICYLFVMCSYTKTEKGSSEGRKKFHSFMSFSRTGDCERRFVIYFAHTDKEIMDVTTENRNAESCDMNIS
jgi:hypothetical protein